MTKDKIQSLIQDIASMCRAAENGESLDLDAIESHVENLSREVTTFDIASDSLLKTDLESLDSMLGKLSLLLRQVQENLSSQMSELNDHHRALHAYSRVANNNLLH